MKDRYFYPNQVTEKAILVGVVAPGIPSYSCEPLTELERLTETAGAQVVAKLTQHRPHPHVTTYIGKGKLEELKRASGQLQANLVICDDDLTPSQIKNLENDLKRKVIDRTELILDIFAAHARTREAKMQVELAQLQYALPRLRHMWGHLDRYAGGIGGRGPGEKQLEVDRRAIRDKIHALAEEIKGIERQKQREVHTRKEKFLTLAIVGYTNAGKSTLMNTLTNANVLVEDQLFSTLDTRTRMWEINKGRRVLISDTVGFIEKLPHHLIASFKATLEEASQADLLLHVVDVSHPDALQQITVVSQVLESIGLAEKPILLVFNKIDAVSEQAELHQIATLYPEHVAISAKHGTNLVAFSHKIVTMLETNMSEVHVAVPFTQGKLMAWIKENANILQQSPQSQEIHYVLKLSAPQASWFLQQEGIRGL